MALVVPRLLRRLRPALAHFQHALPLALPVPGGRHGPRPLVRARRDGDGPPRPAASSSASSRARRGARGSVIAVSERTKRDLSTSTAIPPERIAVTPHGVDPAFGAGRAPRGARDYLLFVGAIQARKDPLAAAEAARGGRAAARRRRARAGAGARARARAARRRPARLRREGRARRPLPRRRRARPARRATRASACRCWRRWPAGRRSSRTPTRRCARSPATRPSTRSRRPGRGDPRGRSPSATGSSPPGSSARRRSAGTRRRAARSTSTARRCAMISAIVVSHGHRDGARRVAAGARAAGRRDRR